MWGEETYWKRTGNDRENAGQVEAPAYRCIGCFSSKSCIPAEDRFRLDDIREEFMEKSRVRGKRRHGAVNKMALLAITAGAVAFGAGCGNSVMDRKAALGFALEDAGLTADDITVTRQELEKEDGRAHYEIVFTSGGYGYYYEIDASSGAVTGVNINALAAAGGESEQSENIREGGSQPGVGQNQEGGSQPGGEKGQESGSQPGGGQGQEGGGSQFGGEQGQESGGSQSGGSQGQESGGSQGQEGGGSQSGGSQGQEGGGSQSQESGGSQPGGSQGQESGGSQFGGSQGQESGNVSQSGGGQGQEGGESQSSRTGQVETMDAAKTTALADAGLTEGEVTFTKEKLDWDDGVAVYDIEFYTADREYEYEINATTGIIMDRSEEVLRNPGNYNVGTDPLIGEEKAKEIAAAHAGFSTAEVFFTKVKLEQEDGRMEYEIEFYKDRVEYEATIDAAAGTVLEYESEYDD